MGSVPSKPTDPTVTPQVIAAGYSRTGTMSMAKALETLLGGTVLHSGNALYGREDEYAQHWVKVLRARKDKPKLLKLLREATVGYVAITDAPAVLFVPELVELYPDAKVIVVDRDTEQWWASMQPLLKSTGGVPNWVLKQLLLPCFTWRWIPHWLPEMKALTKETHGAELTKDLKDKHNAIVRASVPRKYLLEMQTTDGWAPLCTFLKKPVPSEPFPQENDAEAFDAAVKNMFTMALMTWAMYIIGYGGGLVGIFIWLKSSGRI